jgi:GT2 family glycosyltransferase
MRKVATVVLNRNLPEVTDRLCESLERNDGDVTDVYVVEAGSDPDRLSDHTTWHADWPDARNHGLRYPRGMNFGLSQLMKEGRFGGYEAFLLLTNDTELDDAPTVGPLLKILADHPRVGILSPCSRRWGELNLLTRLSVKYFWFIHNSAYLLRREFLETIVEQERPDHMNFVFDGSNFRGYGSESELIAKAYANDWAAAITSTVWAEENESYLLDHADLIRTEDYQENLRLYVEEGRRWMRRKYGFNSRWAMQQYVRLFYTQFFELHPEFHEFKI